MNDASQPTSQTASRGARAALVVIAGLAAAVALVLTPVGSARADWESDYHEPNTYWGLQANLVVPNFASQIGEDASRPYTGVHDVADVAGGLTLHFGYRVHPYIAWEVAVEWTGGVNFEHDGGSADINVLTGNVLIKGYPLAKLLDTVVDGRIQPYMYVAPGLVGATGTTIKTPIHFNFGLGGGVDFWLNESWTVHGDFKYSWSFGTLEGLDYATIGLGAGYHF